MKYLTGLLGLLLTIVMATSLSAQATVTTAGTGGGVLDGSQPVDVDFAVTGLTGANVVHVSVDMAIFHDWVGDVSVTLTDPQLNNHVIFDTINASGTTFGDDSHFGDVPGVTHRVYTFNDLGTEDIWVDSGNSLGDIEIVPAGDYRTKDAAGNDTSMNAVFSVLTTAQANGTWTLTFNDAFAGADDGDIDAASCSLTVSSVVPNANPSISVARDASTTPVTINNNDNIQVALNDTVASLDLEFDVSDINSGDQVSLTSTAAPSANINGFAQGEWDIALSGQPVTPATPSSGTFDTAGVITVTIDASDDASSAGTSQLVFTIEVLAPELVISATGPGPVGTTAPQTDMVVATFDASANIGGNQTISDVQVDKSGAMADADITEVELWVDVNSNGTLETATDIQLGAAQQFASGSTTFTGLAEVVNSSTTTDFLVTFTLSGAATGTFGADIGSVIATPGAVTGAPLVGPVHSILTPVSALPFLDDFEAGNPGNRSTQLSGDFPEGTGPIITGTYAAQSQVQFGPVTASGVTPTSGSNQAGIDFPAAGTPQAAGAINYLFDLSSFDANLETLILQFSWAEDGDEDSPGDGVFLSLDGGATWVLNLDVLQGGSTTHQTRTVDVSAALVGATLNYTNSVVIRFQGQDNFPFGSDGHVFDDIQLGEPAEIDVTRNSTSIPHRGSVNVGGVNVVAGGQETFDIENLGGVDLDLTGTPDLVAVTAGANISSVNVNTQPNTPVTSGASESFIVDFTPTGAGPFDFTVQIDNSDASPAEVASGTDGNLTTAAASAFNSPTANFVAADIGGEIVISNSASGNDGRYTITAVVSATTVTLGSAPAANETPVDWSLQVSEGSYTFTVTGTGVTNGAAEADPAAGSSFSGPTNGPLTQAVAPGSTLANADVELSDPENDTITVASINLSSPAVPPTGITAPSVPAPGEPITIGWTGTADASNAPGDYTWTVTFSDAVNGSVVNVDVTITINDVPPTHTILNATGGDGSAGTPYLAGFAVGDSGANSVDLATVSDANTGQTVTLGTVNEGGGNPTTGVFQFTLSGGSLTVAPAGTLIGADVGTHDFDMTISDGAPANDQTINVSIDVAANLPPVVTVGGAWVDAGGGLFTLTVNPGDAINDALTADDPTPDMMTVTVTPPGAALTGLTVSPTDISTPTAGPITLQWTGTADASNPPGDYDWTIDIDDGAAGTSITARITVNDVVPTHVAAAGISGDGSAGTPYTTSFVDGDTSATVVSLSNVSDGNTGQTVTLGTVNEGGGNPSTGVFSFALTGGVLSVAPAGTLGAADVGAHTFDMTVSDGTPANDQTINVSVDVVGSSGAIMFTNTSPLADGTVGQSYTVTLTATGGTAPYAYSLANGTSLPTGLTLGAGGAITGTPTVAGTVTFDVRAVDSSSPADSGAATFQIMISGSTSGGGDGDDDDDGGCSTGGDAPYSWMIVLGLLSLLALGVRIRNSKA